MEIRSGRDLRVFQLADQVAVEIFAISREFPHCENNETATSILFTQDCSYLTAETATRILEENREIGRMLGAMIRTPQPFLIRP